MTDIIELAKEAGVIPQETNIAYMQGDFPQRLERFAALVRAKAIKEQNIKTLFDAVYSATTDSIIAESERKWVDLTDDEILDLVTQYGTDDPHWFARAVIAAFKEKNK